MKKLIFPILSGLVLSCANSNAQDTKFKEQIHKEFTVSPNAVLAVYNIDGFIKVESYAGNKILIDVDKTISGKTNEIMEEGKKEFKLEFEQKGDSVFAYISYPYDSRPNQNKNDWQHQRKIQYRTNLNFTIKVPNTINMAISTINNGNIDIENVFGKMKVNNINGAISVKNAKNANEIHTINGDVTINYTTLPPDNSKYYTLNGDLKVIYPANFSADCEFKSFNGEFYTDFDKIENLPAKTIKNVKEKNGSTTYKLDKINQVRIGNGGKNLKFETFNGNIYIKKG